MSGSGLGGAMQRRLTSVLFADLVSYTELAGERDSEEVRDLLTAYFEACKTVIHRYGGTIEKFIGDAVMAVWGVPTAHEDDAERAVRAALELVTAISGLGDSLGLPGLALRAGVVTGEVAATVGATDQGMVAGDPVNTAARVQTTAAPGEVLVDAATRSLTIAAIDYTDAGEHALKGKPAPVRLFRADAVVASLGGRQRIDGLEAPLTGRARELRLLKELFHGTQESGRPRLVVIDGAAGIGKSRLTWEFEKYLDGLPSTVRWHRGRCRSYGDGLAFWALAEAVRGRLGITDTAGHDAVTAALDRVLDTHVTADTERAWLRSRLAALIGGEGSEGEQGGETNSTELDTADLFAAWTRFFERTGDGEHPVGLVIEDGQHVDTGLLDFLEHLLSHATVAVFVLVVARPELLAERPGLGGRRTTVVRLDPLGTDAMNDLLDGLVAGLPAVTREALADRADGIPLYAVETVRALIDRDLVRPREGRYVVPDGTRLDIAALPAPRSLQALVAARLDTLTPSERQVVADCSLLGMTMRTDEIRAQSGVENLDEVLESLQRKEILAPDQDLTAHRDGYRFVQSVLHQVAYSTLSRRDRKAGHLRAAAHLAAQAEYANDQAPLIAQHLLDAVAASDAGDSDVGQLRQRAADLLGKAGSRACALCSFEDGLRLMESALATLTDATARAELQKQAARAALAVGSADTARQLAAAAVAGLDSAGSSSAAAEAAALQASAMMHLGNHRDARELLRGRYEAASEPAARLQLAIPLSRAHGQLGEHDAARAAHQDGLRLAEQLQDVGRTAQAMNLMAVDQLAHGSTRVGFAVLREVIALSEQHGLWENLVRAHNTMCALRVAYSCAEGIEHGEAGRRIAVDHGQHGWSEIVTANLCVALWTAGEWPRLAEVLTQYAETRTDHEPLSLSIVQTVEQWRADAGLSPIVPHQPVPDADSLAARAWQEHLQMLTRAEQPSDALRHGLRAVELSLRDKGRQDDFVHLWPPALRLAIDTADSATADRLVEVVESAPPGEITPALRAHALVLRAAMDAAAHADPAAVEKGFRDGIGGLEAYGAAGHRAHASERFGRWLAAQGRSAEAAAALDSARHAYAGLGASTWLRRLDDAGPRPVAQTAGSAIDTAIGNR